MTPTTLILTPELVSQASAMLAANGCPLDNRVAVVNALFWWLTVQRQVVGEDVGGRLLGDFSRTPLVRDQIPVTMDLAERLYLQLLVREEQSRAHV